MDGLLQQFKTGDIRSLYLFYGDEKYLVDLYEKNLKKKLLQPEDEMMNLEVLSGKVTVPQIRAAAETLPFFVDRRLVIVKDSGAFDSEGKAMEELAEFFKDPPEFTVLLFVESKVDRRSKNYKAIQKNGYVVEFATQSEDRLNTWLRREAKNQQLVMDQATAAYFIKLAGTDMVQLSREMEKLFSYKKGTGRIDPEDLDRIITPSLETNIFRMMDAIGNKHPQEAFKIYRNQVQLGENLYGIFAMLRRQIGLLYKTSVYLKERYNADQIAEAMKIKLFIARKNMDQARKFPHEKLQKAMLDMLDYDVSIKSGTMKPERAIEMMIARFTER